MFGSWSISHDFAFELGGAERVTAEMARLLPSADVHLIAGNDTTLRKMGVAERTKVHAPGFINERNYRPLAPLHSTMLSIERPIKGNLIASSYGFAHMFSATGNVVAYMHSPLRQAWSGVSAYSAAMPHGVGLAWRYLGAPIIRSEDRKAARRAHSFIATSRAVRDRIRNYYGVDAVIIPPPVDSAFCQPGPETERNGNYLWAGRIVEPYKRLGLLVEAFRDSPQRQLHIVGDGRDRAVIQANAPSNVHFLGSLDTPSLAREYRSAVALIMPSEDDFGMVAAEAISSGTPVIALAAGGALDTVTHGRSGILYSESSVRGLQRGLQEFESESWNTLEVAEYGQRYSTGAFRTSISEYLTDITVRSSLTRNSD